jgi:Sulfatase
MQLEAQDVPTTPAAAPFPRHWKLKAFLELCGLCGLAITQPVLDVLGRSPDFLLVQGLSAMDVVLVAVVFGLLPPVLLWSLDVAAGLAGWRWHRAAHLLLVAGLLAALAIEVGKHVTSVRGLPLVLAAAAVALGATVVYLVLELGWVLRVTAVAPLLSVGIFLFASPTSALVLSQRAPAAQAGAAMDAAKHPPIVVVAFDELPTSSLLDTRGRVDAANFPNFAWLAERSTWYRNATAMTQWTRDAFPSMLTGRYPSRSLAATYDNYPFNLFTLLDGTYELDVHESATRLCPPSRCETGTGRATDGGLRAALGRSSALLGELVSPSDPKKEPSADVKQPLVKGRPAGFPEFLQGLRPSATPSLHYVHLVLPHRPWRFLPSGLRYPDTPGTYGIPFPSAKWEAEPTWTRLGHQRHWLQLAYADRLLGETLLTLKTRGLLDQAVVLVTADHGMSFDSGTQARILGNGNEPGIMWVPLFVKEPGQRSARTDDRNWEHVDLLPTLADYAGVALPWKVDGRSALRGQPRKETTKHFFGIRESGGPPKPYTVQGPPNLAAALRGGELPARPEVRPRLGAESGRELDRLVPRPELLGRAVDGFQVVAGGPALAVDDLGAFRNVRPGRGEVPAFVHGTAPSGLPPGTLVAIALNGRIGTVASVAPEGPRHTLRFAGMLPGPSFVDGANRLEVLVVEGAGRLRRLPLRAA